MSNYSGDIAIVGMAGIYPDAEDIDAFWGNILAKHDAVTEAPAEWLGASDLYDPTSDELMAIYTKKGGFLGDLSRFNSAEFGTMPRSVIGAQPDQFMALRICSDALIDAGYKAGQTDHTRTGVILGHAVHAHRSNTNGIQQAWFNSQLRYYLQALFPDADEATIKLASDKVQQKLPVIEAESIPGLVPNIMTGRVANRLDLMGPNYIIDAACSSSLITVELAANELRAGNADMMIAGGVNTTTSPLVYSVFCSVEALSPTGKIRPFSNEANGTILGEGAGAVVLKRLEDALAADDRIYAVVKAVGQSSDGKSSGLMAPRFEGEVLAMRRAYEQCGLDPRSVGLVEAHGTGIPLGDRTEISALREIFGTRDGDIPSIPIGSVKSMIGHCIPAAGSAAIIKNALALTNRVIPPTLCDEVNEDLGIADTPFYVSTEARPWVHSAKTPRRAAINAFGFGGINAHIVLEESPVGREMDATATFMPRAASAKPAEQIFVLGADSPDVMAQAVSGLRDAAEGLEEEAFAELARNSWSVVGAAPARLAVVATDPADLAKKLAAAEKHLAKDATKSLQTRNGLYYEPSPIEGKTAFLFPGEMAQYPDMMADAVMTFPQMRAWFDQISSLFDGERDLRLQDVIFPPTSGLTEEGASKLEARMHSVDFGSEMVFAADQAIFGMLQALGVQPDGLLGHSTGENAAIVASGWFGMDSEQVGDTIKKMNGVFNSVNSSGEIPEGQLLTIAGLDREAFTAAFEKQSGLHFTMDNCPNQAIVFGPADTIDALQKDVVEQGAVCTKLPISWGYHTEYVAPMAKGFGELFSDLEMNPTSLELWSCATAKPFAKNREEFLETAIAQYVSRVAFREAIENMHAAGYTRFVECGPNATLTAFVRDILPKERILAVSADNRRRGMVSQLRHLVAQMFTAGGDLGYPERLDHKSDAAEEARQELRAKRRKAMPLPSNLPFPELDEAEKTELRALLGAGQVASAPSAPVTIVQQAHNGDAAVGQHLSMMNSFLSGQERVAHEALGARKAQIRVLDISDQFALPMAYRGILMEGLPTPRGMANHLHPAEQETASYMAGEDASSDRWAHWSLGRLAVKRAARDYLGLVGETASDREICIVKSDLGAPKVLLPERGLELPGTTIAHAGGMAIGAVAAPPYRIGIDYDFPERIRDAESLLASILSPREREVVPVVANAWSATLYWTIKEAAAKTLGTGLQGRPETFEIVEFDQHAATAKVEYQGQKVDTQSRQMGAGICTIGYCVSH
ncbi:type I polyketide synthase [Celeribacter litoreus]|uniref:type I polyketide synthase n=1 Tax=Celeribacter litoreus TaxID=2876714 RepID=UPI001CCA116E|nr:type I polyketide synthase [Celeribacter litoreus]MCA0045087.1 acyltransferase domain-containing protein [Celeribacter litoreus]